MNDSGRELQVQGTEFYFTRNQYFRKIYRNVTRACESWTHNSAVLWPTCKVTQFAYENKTTRVAWPSFSCLELHDLRQSSETELHIFRLFRFRPW